MEIVYIADHWLCCLRIVIQPTRVLILSQVINYWLFSASALAVLLVGRGGSAEVTADSGDLETRPIAGPLREACGEKLICEAVSAGKSFPTRCAVRVTMQ